MTDLQFRAVFAVGRPRVQYEDSGDESNDDSSLAARYLRPSAS